jgi:hypothetical protein
MAAPIHCDEPGHYDVLADYLVTNLNDGQTLALCGDHFVAFCKMIGTNFEERPQPEEGEEETAEGEPTETPGGAFPGTKNVVKRGTSARARAYRAREREKLGQLAPVPPVPSDEKRRAQLAHYVAAESIDEAVGGSESSS